MNIAIRRPRYNRVKVIPLSDPGKGLDYSTIAKTVKPVVQFLKGRSKRPWTLRPKANRRSIPRRRPASAPLKGGLPWAGRSAHGVPTESRPTKAHRAGVSDLWPTLGRTIRTRVPDPRPTLNRALRARGSRRRPTYRGTPCRALPPGPPWAGHTAQGSRRRPTYKGTPCRALPPGPPWAGRSAHGARGEAPDISGLGPMG